MSCTCVSARLAQFFIHVFIWQRKAGSFTLCVVYLHRQELSYAKSYAFARFDKTVCNVIQRFSQRPFSAISDSLWGLLKAISRRLDSPVEAFRSSRKLFVRPNPVWNGLDTILTPKMRANLPPKLSESLKKNHHESNQHVYLLRTSIFN